MSGKNVKKMIKLLDILKEITEGNPKTLDKYWGTDKQSYYRPGPNPTVDLVVKYNDGNTIKILLIKRSSASKA